LILAVVHGALYYAEEEIFLLNQLKVFFGNDFEIDIIHVKELSKTATGKFVLVEQHLLVN
jgi:hypothetical protein